MPYFRVHAESCCESHGAPGTRSVPGWLGSASGNANKSREKEETDGNRTLQTVMHLGVAVLSE